MAISVVKNVSIGEIQWNFPTLGVVTLHIERLSQAVRDHAMFDRLADRCTDAMALERADFPGFTVPEEAKMEALMDMVQHLESGTVNWNKTGAPRLLGERHLLARVFEEVEGRKPDRAALKAKKPNEIAKMLVLPRYKEVADRIKAEMVAEATKGIDAEELMKGL